MAETTRNHIFSKEISQVIIAATNLGFLGFKIPQKTFLRPSRESMLPWKIWKTEPLRLAKNAFPAYSYGHEVS